MSGPLRPTIFREYDIRGVYGQDFSLDDFEAMGRALGDLFQQAGEHKAVVGRDNRLSSPALASALAAGLARAGVAVTDIGLVTTPAFYFARRWLRIPAGAMVTASHNPPEHNGLKVGLGEGTWYGPEIQAVRARLAAPLLDRPGGGVVQRAVGEAYVEDLLSRIELGPRPLQVVVDSGHGAAGPFAAQALGRLPVSLMSLNETPDGTYPCHHPDPTQPENLRLLCDTVRETRADVGIAFDGDGDRLGVVDEEGRPVPADRFMLLFWEEILAKHPGAEALVEVKCSQVLFDAIAAMGGRPRFCRTGHSLIKAEMRSHDIVFAGEMSGHMFFRDEHPGYDDALYAALRLLRILSHKTEPLSRLLARWPEPVATPELRLACPDEAKADVVARACTHLSQGHEVVTVDGVRARFPQGWGLVRVSNTQPALIVRAEARDLHALRGIAAELAAVLREAYRALGIATEALAALEAWA